MLRRSLVVATVLGCLLGCLGAPVAMAGSVAAADASAPTPAAPGSPGDAPERTGTSNLTAGVENLTTGVANLTTGVTNETFEGTGYVLDLAGLAPDQTDVGPAVTRSNGTTEGVNVNDTRGDDDSRNDTKTAAGWVDSTTDGGESDEAVSIDEGRLRGLANGTFRVLGPLNETLGADRLLNETLGADRLLNDTLGADRSPDGEGFSDRGLLDDGVLAPDDEGVAELRIVEPYDRVGTGNDSVAMGLQDPTDVVGTLHSVAGVTDLRLPDLLAGLAPGVGSTEWPVLDRGVAEVGDDGGQSDGVDLAVEDSEADEHRDETSDATPESTPSDAATDAGESEGDDDGGATEGTGSDGDGGEADGGADGDGSGSGAGAGAAMVLTVGCLGGTRTAVDQAAVLASPGSRTALSALRQAVGVHLGQFADRVIPVVLGASRLTDSDALDNDTRAEIYDLVCESPGTYHAQLAAETDVTEETVRYHSRVLADEGLVESRKHRGRRRLYPVTTGEDDAELSAAMADSAASDVLSAIERREPTTLTSIAEALECAPSTVSYHLDRLEADGLVSRERDGGSVTVELRTSTRSALESPVADD